MADPASTTADTQQVSQVVEAFVRELSAYRKETQLYPPGHPRLEDRIDSLRDTLDSYTEDHGELRLQVWNETLATGDQPLSETSEAVKSMASQLRERMIQLLVFRPGIKENEIQSFVGLLVMPAEEAINEALKAAKSSPWPRIGVHCFSEHFGEEQRALTEAEILAAEGREAPAGMVAEPAAPAVGAPAADDGDAMSAEPGAATPATGLPDFESDGTTAAPGAEQVPGAEQIQVPGAAPAGAPAGALVEAAPAPQSAKQTLLDILDEDQLEGVHEVVACDEVKAQIEGLRRQFSDVSANDSVDFMDRFFAMLARDPNCDWDDTDALKECVLAGFELLREARRKRTDVGALPTQLLIPNSGVANQLTTHFRWQLLKNFFPGEVAAASPREAEDLSFTSKLYTAREPEPLDDIDGTGWGDTALDEFREPFRIQFLPSVLYAEYTGVVHELMAITEEAEERKELRKEYYNAVRGRIDDKVHAASFIRGILQHTDHLPITTAALFLVPVVRLVPPEMVFDVLDLGDPRVRDALLDNPPIPLKVPLREDWASYQRPRELLRQVILPSGKFAFNVCLHLLTSEDGDRATHNGWLDLFQEMAYKNERFEGWIHSNAALLFRPDAIPLLLQLPYDELRLELMRFFSHQEDTVLQRFFIALERFTSPVATRLLLLGLEFESPPVRKVVIDALGSQSDPKAIQALENLLTFNNDVEYDEDEVETICSALCRVGGEPAREVLGRVVKEKSGALRHRYRRGIRKQARSALKRLGISTGETL